MKTGEKTARAITLDLGGTQFRVAVGTRSGVMEWRSSRATRAERGRDMLLQDIYDTVDEALVGVSDRKSLKGIAIGAPGPLDPWTGVLHTPPNLPGWDTVPIKQLFEDRYGLPTVVGNDANLAAVGEHSYGAGRGIANLIYVTVSTGIGGGIIADNRLQLGHRGFAGEIGHMTIDLNGPVCACGNVGCLESLASGTAIARMAKEQVAAGIATALNRVNPEQITARMVTEAALDGDQVSNRILQETGIALGVGMVNLAHMFNPRRIIIGGGVSNAGQLLWEPMLQIIRERALSPSLKDLEVVPATLGDDAGLLGGVAMVTLGLCSSPSHDIHGENWSWGHADAQCGSNVSRARH